MVRNLARRLLTAVPANKRYALLRELAGSFGITTVVAEGSCGPIEGNLHDWTIFRSYVIGRQPWERTTTNVIVDFFDRNGIGTYLDIGSHIGLLLIPVVQRTGVFGIGFEPSPLSYHYLERNCRRHLGDDVCQLHNVALGNENGTIGFWAPGSQFHLHKIDPAGELKVPLRTLDSTVDLASCAKPILAKVDIEGAEKKFLEGAKESLPLIDGLIIEYAPENLPDNDEDASFLKVLSRYFSRYHVIEPGIKRDGVEYNTECLEINRLLNLKEVMKIRNYDHLNILFTK